MKTSSIVTLSVVVAATIAFIPLLCHAQHHIKAQAQTPQAPQIRPRLFLHRRRWSNPHTHDDRYNIQRFPVIVNEKRGLDHGRDETTTPTATEVLSSGPGPTSTATEVTAPTSTTADNPTTSIFSSTNIEPTSNLVPPPESTTEAPSTATTPVEPTVTTVTTDPPISTTDETTTTVPPVTEPPTTPPTIPPTIPPISPPTNPPSSPSSNPSLPATRPPRPTNTKSSDGGNSGGKLPSEPSATSSDVSATPSDGASSGSSSSSNKTAITIGAVIGGIVVAGGIGVWIFRKWKLTPSRQFKTKIRTSGPGGIGSATVGSSPSGDVVEDNYTDIFRPIVHDSALAASSMMSPGTATGAGASIAGSSPPLPHQQYHPYDQAMYDQTMYDQTIYDRAIFDQAQHMSMSSSGATVPDYGQYRYAQASPTPVLSNHQVNGSGAYDSGVHDAIIGGHVHGSGAQGGHPIAHPYTSQDYSGHDDHFLRELRE